MAIQNAERPRGEYQQSGAGEEDADQPDGQFALGSSKPGAMTQIRYGVSRTPMSTITDVASARIAAHRAGDAAGFLLVSLGEQARIHRDEGCGKHTFAEQVLQEIGDTKGGVEGIGFIELAEVMGEDALPHQSDDAADQNPRGYQKRVAAGALPFHVGH